MPITEPFPYMSPEIGPTALAARESAIKAELASLEAERAVLNKQLRPIVASIADRERELETLFAWRKHLEQLQKPVQHLPARKASGKAKKKDTSIDIGSLSAHDISLLIARLQTVQVSA